MVQRLVNDASNRPDAIKIATAVLAAGGVALGCWPKGPELNELLRKSVEPLLTGTLQEEFLRDAASITAVTLALMRSQVRQLSEGSLAALVYRRTAEEAAPLLTYAEREDIEYRCAGFVAEGLVQLTDVDHVMDVVHTALNPDPIAVAVEELTEDGIAAEAEGRLIKLLGKVPNAVSAALRAVAIAEDASPVGVVARDAKNEVVAIWIDPHLFVAQRGGGKRTVARYPLPRLRPSGYLHGRLDDNAPAGTKRLPGALPEADVRTAFEAVGLILEDV
jgi:hypothetical protein